MTKKKTILLTGATGYVGGNLLKRLQMEGHHVRCLARNPENLDVEDKSTEVFEGDVLLRSSMREAFHGVDTAYYLVHALRDKHDFEAREIEAAENFASMAREAGVERIIYLGALGNERDDLSPHLQSRQNVGHALRHSGIQTIELRASIVLGDGSLSFNLIRDLTEHLPVMVLPRWLATQAQPIGIRDLLDYLVGALELETRHSEILEIGGADQVSYGELMREYARQRKIKRIMVPVPVLTPWLSSHWVAFFSSVDAVLARKLIEGIKNPTIVEDHRAQELFGIEPACASVAIEQALSEMNIPVETAVTQMSAKAGALSRHEEHHVYAA